MKIEIKLFHSRFIYKHRKRKEKKILEKLEDEKPKKPYLLIATQVVEVSLDVDFEILITEVAPLPELIQRFGRVNRKRKYIPREPNVYIFTYFDESEKIYEKELMDITLNILKEYVNGGLVNESELIKELDKEEDFKKKYIKLYEESKKEYEDLLNKWIGEHCNYFYYLLSEGTDEETLEEISQLLNIRDSINTLVFVNPEDLEEREKKKFNELEKSLSQSIKERDFYKFFASKLMLKEFTLSLPFYFLKNFNIEIGKGIPILPTRIYSKEIGLNIKELKNKKGKGIIL